MQACEAMGYIGYIFHASSNVNLSSIDQHGLVLSLFAHGLGRGKGRVGVHFVYAGGAAAPCHGAMIRRGKDIHYWNLNYEKFLADGFQLRGTPSGVVLAAADVSRACLGLSTSRRQSIIGTKCLANCPCLRLRVV